MVGTVPVPIYRYCTVGICTVPYVDGTVPAYLPTYRTTPTLEGGSDLHMSYFKIQQTIPIKNGPNYERSHVTKWSHVMEGPTLGNVWTK